MRLINKTLNYALVLMLSASIIVFTWPRQANALVCGAGTLIWNNTSCQVYLTANSKSPWTVPADWNSASSTVELIGAGAGGSGGSTVSGGGVSGSGGDGGAYLKLSNGA